MDDRRRHSRPRISGGARRQTGGVGRNRRRAGDHPLQPRHRGSLPCRSRLPTPRCWSPVVDHGDDATVLLTQRAGDAAQRIPGQIAFPGGAHRPGRCDAGGSGAARGRGGDRPRRPSSSRRSAGCPTTSPARAIISRRSSAIVRPGLPLTPQPGRGRGRFRGAALASSWTRPTTAREAASGRSRERISSRCPMATATSGV